MTIRRGEDWGSTAIFPTGAPIARFDAELASYFVYADGCISGPSHVGLIAGDLARTVGAAASASELLSGSRTVLPIDLGVVWIDDRHVVMAGSLVIRRRWWRGIVEGAMNASFLGRWNPTPSGHPNDGRFDVVHADLSWPDRLKARSRLHVGAHVPHPDISIRRQRSATFTPDSRANVWVDGVCFGPAASVRFDVHADAVNVVI